MSLAADPQQDGEEDAPLSLMEQYLNDPAHDYRTLKYGDVMEGVIMRVDRDEILVDIGSKSEGVVPVREFSSLSSEEKQELAPGETILVFVVQAENQEGNAVVSIDRARQEKSWRKLQDIHEADEVIDAEVVNYNKGGLLVNLDGVRGFVPASQVTEIRGGDDASKQADMARLIGSHLTLKVIEINRHRNRLILSERQAMQERRDEMKVKLIEELKEGEVRRGRVSSICDFGAFVDIGGADGLVHLSELSWSRVRHPSEVLKVGQEVDVHVLAINPQEKKIALSIKRTLPEPWSKVADSYEVGQLVRGTVTQLANFGAFARIEDGVEGLIHVSEIVSERINHPKQIVREGQDLLLRIIRIDPERRRMGLSLQRALETPDEELIAALGEGVLDERDRLLVEIAAALEAEGIEPESGDEDEEEDETPGAVAAAVTETVIEAIDTEVLVGTSAVDQETVEVIEVVKKPSRKKAVVEAPAAVIEAAVEADLEVIEEAAVLAEVAAIEQELAVEAEVEVIEEAVAEAEIAAIEEGASEAELQAIEEVAVVAEIEAVAEVAEIEAALEAFEGVAVIAEVEASVEVAEIEAELEAFEEVAVIAEVEAIEEESILDAVIDTVEDVIGAAEGEPKT